MDVQPVVFGKIWDYTSKHLVKQYSFLVSQNGKTNLLDTDPARNKHKHLPYDNHHFTNPFYFTYIYLYFKRHCKKILSPIRYHTFSMKDKSNIIIIYNMINNMAFLLWFFKSHICLYQTVDLMQQTIIFTTAVDSKTFHLHSII